MKTLSLLTALAIGAAAPAFASSGQAGNAEQQTRPVPQTGQTTGGPAD